MKNEQGFVLITTMLVLSLFLALFGAYYLATQYDIATVRSTKNSSTGFFSAEAGLNLRADQIRSVFVGFNRPSGTSPSSTAPCEGGNQGGGDFSCETYNFNNREVVTYVEEDPGNPVVITIPPGERYQNLSAQEYRYTAISTSINSAGDYEAELQLKFRSRLVPLFQFAAFYTNDLEILPGPVMSLSGPIHTNGDLYLYSNSSNLDILGQITTAGDLWRGRKDGSVSPSCNNRPVRVMDPGALRTLIPTCSSRTKATDAHIAPFNGMIQTNVQELVVPGPEVFDAGPGAVYWDHADLRLVLNLDGAENPTSVQVVNPDNSVDATGSTVVNSAAQCPGTVSGKCVGHTQIYNFREAKWIRLLDIDLQALLNSLHNTNWFSSGKRLNDSTDGGLVFHLTVRGPNSSGINRYGVRIKNANSIASNVSGAPTVQGFTVVSDQAAYVQGHFNRVNQRPSAVMADSLNVLSTGWNDANSNLAISSRVAQSTTIYAAFLAGTDITGNVNGVGGQGGAYNGGLENYPRFHENWSGRVLTYRGSFVSLGKPLHVQGTWSAQSYSPPNRDWNYDISFNNAANLPPITPRFVYLRQELFVRDFDRG